MSITGLSRRVGAPVVAKAWAIRALWRMWWHLANWREVWAAYRLSQTLPVLQFRRGFALHHGPADDPILLLHTVFATSEYGALATPRSRVLLDIGANIGAVTLDCAWQHENVRVDAYEPNPATYESLQRNIRKNGLEPRVRTFQEAVTGQDGVVVLWTGESSVLASTSAVTAVGGASMSVATVSLDRAITRTGADHLSVKIDAEGAEVDMLESASDEALAAIDELVLEYHDSLVPDARVRCEAVLMRAGFACHCTPFNADQGILVARRRPRRAGPMDSGAIGR